MRVPVWVDEWQFACCGEDFAVGDEVRWQLLYTADPWLSRKLGRHYPDWRAELAAPDG